MKVLDQLPEGKCKLIKTVLTVLLHDYIYIFIINLNVMMMIKSVITCMPKSLEISVRHQLNIGLFLFSLTRIFRYWSTLIGRTSHHNLWKTSSFLKQSDFKQKMGKEQIIGIHVEPNSSWLEGLVRNVIDFSSTGLCMTSQYIWHYGKHL